MTNGISDLVLAGGTGDSTDVHAVIAAAAALPATVLARFRASSARIVACRTSVTDFETSLRGVVPRGWEGLGRTWDSVPGTYLDGRKSVVIATVAAGAGRQVTPRGPTTHGAFSLVVHESMHGYDRLESHRVLQDPAFVAARTADWAKLGGYERQAGMAGLEETYAESASRYFGGDPALAADWPNLRAYWHSAALEAALTDVALSEPGGPLPELPPSEPGGPLGTVRIDDSRTIYLDLRAEGPDGAIGHAALEFREGDPVHERLSNHLTSSAAFEEGPLLFYPLGD
ncbi:MAG TPA: hypothetical protein VN640_02990 [Sphingomicrobium sp.]|nr:hypothetical protein [Sphingomicrobium sp.]